MRIKAKFQYKPENFMMDDCQIERVLELSFDEFCDLRILPLQDRKYIAKNRDCMFSKNGVMHCLLILGEDSNDGILIESEGYCYPRYAAYIPGMRDIVIAEMDRAADFIIQKGLENTCSGSWCAYFEELEKHSGLTIRVGSGLDKLLLDAFQRRREVAGVEMTGDCIDISFYTDFCVKIQEMESASQAGNDTAFQQMM